MNQSKLKYINDKFKSTRCGYSHSLDIYCQHCGKYILLYQKDEPGQLKRLYLDRIFFPSKISDLRYINILHLN